MHDIVLEHPMIKHEIPANQFKKEFFDHHEKVIHGSALFDQMDYRNWLVYIQKNKSLLTVSKEWVVATTFFAVRVSDHKIIGIIDIRHSLENQFLAEYGGHIGYSVRPSERKKGYATQMLMLALQYAKLLNLTRVMLGCFTDNMASIRTIEKCRGVASQSKLFNNERPMKVYWIDIS